MTPVQVFDALGLFGTWSPACSQPPSASNPRVTWVRAPDGVKVIHTVTLDGRTVFLRDTVIAATILRNQTAQLRIARSDDFSMIVTLRATADYVQPLRTVGSDGHVFYDNGIERSTGRPSVIDERCVAATS